MQDNTLNFLLSCLKFNENYCLERLLLFLLAFEYKIISQYIITFTLKIIKNYIKN